MPIREPVIEDVMVNEQVFPLKRPDPRDPDYSRKNTFFQYHNCWKCDNGNKPCVTPPGNVCEYPHARND